MINERKLTEKELEKREVALKGLLQNKQSLVKKYGKEAEKVMYGIATKQAKSKVEAMNLDKIKETIQGLDIGSKVKIAKEYGIKVYHDVPNKKVALAMRDVGVDGLYCINWRGGGQTGIQSAEQFMEELHDISIPLICFATVFARKNPHHERSSRLA